MGSNNNWIRQDPIMIRLIRLLISKHKQVSWVGQKSYPPLSQVDDRKEEGSWGSKVNTGLYSLSSIKKKKSNHIRIGFLCLMHFPSPVIQSFRKLGQNVAVLSDDRAPFRHRGLSRGEGWYQCPYRHARVSRDEGWRKLICDCLLSSVSTVYARTSLSSSESFSQVSVPSVLRLFSFIWIQV